MGRRKRKVGGISFKDVQNVDWTKAASMGLGGVAGFAAGRLAQGGLKTLEIGSTGETLQDKLGENTVNIALAFAGAGGAYLASKKMKKNSALPVEFVVSSCVGLVIGATTDLINDNIVAPISEQTGIRLSGTGYYGSRLPRHRIGAAGGWDNLQGQPYMSGVYKDRYNDKGVGSIENLQGREVMYQ